MKTIDPHVDAPDSSWAVELLRRHGLLEDPEEGDTRPLTGGVSSDIVLVGRVAGPDLVVKRALATLRVASAWESDPARSETEAAALRLAGELCPDGAPEVVLYDPAQHTIVMHAAPPDWLPWKTHLLAGDIDGAVAQTLGTFLGRLHAATCDDDAVRSRFGDLTHLYDLRVDAYYETTAHRHPNVATEIVAWGHHLLEDRRCLVHGDFSPKNVLVEFRTFWGDVSAA